MKELSKKIRERRRELGMTQQQLGEKAGCVYASISNIEKGKGCTTDKLIAICDALDLDIELKERK